MYHGPVSHGRWRQRRALCDAAGIEGQTGIDAEMGSVGMALDGTLGPLGSGSVALEVAAGASSAISDRRQNLRWSRPREQADTRFNGGDWAADWARPSMTARSPDRQPAPAWPLPGFPLSPCHLHEPHAPRLQLNVPPADAIADAIWQIERTSLRLQ